ncbi:L,D-transpeptidase [Actinoplanes sp. NPDC049596]|uniref:L,D-transpeptidase n=1 Tax=unclassified Actinoplanes TaxID=2626549 RepID=UPI00343D1AB2
MARFPSSRRMVAGWVFVATLAGGAGVARLEAARPVGVMVADRVAVVRPVGPVRDRVVKAVPAPRWLPRIDYWGAPGGFPRDAAPGSMVAITEGLRPLRKLAVYDAPGGRPRAFLPRSFSGLEVTVPIVERRPGWVGVLLPSLNRRIGWIPAAEATPSAGAGRGAGWESRRLRDRLVVDRREHRLSWMRDGRLRQAWKVAVGSPRTPTPLGRTFVLGPTPTIGGVYAGLDALVLGAVPDNREALAPALRNGHTAIHAWTRESAFGRSISNGCVRLPADAQRALLRQIEPGTPVHVVAGR